MRVECLKGDKRKAEYAILHQWMNSTALLCHDFWQYKNGFFPFHDNEASAVSLLVAGAARANYIPISEYRISKRGKVDKRERRPGRADLWFVAQQKAFSFEFKRSLDATSLSDLKRVMKNATDDVECIVRDEYDLAFAGVIAPTYEEAAEGCYSKFADSVDYAFKIGNEETFFVHFYFDRLK